MPPNKEKNKTPVKKPISATHRFFQKLGYKDEQQLRFVLVHDAKNNYYQRYNNNSNSNSNYSAYGKTPALLLFKPFHLIEHHVPSITLYSNSGQSVLLSEMNTQGYAIFMEVNYRESRQSNFQDIRAQFIDVDLNKKFSYADTQYQAIEKAKSLQASTSDPVTNVSITRTPSGRYMLLADRTKSRIKELKKAYLERHRSSIKDAMIVETKNGFHMYWPMKNASIDKFVPIQKALVQKFSSDPNITNLARAMRIPGFHHMKDPDDPFMVKVKQWGRSQRFSQNELVSSLELNVGGNAQHAHRSRSII